MSPQPILVIGQIESGLDLFSDRYTVLRTSSEASASRLLEMKPVDAVIVSHEPPRLDGLGLVSKIRKKCPGVPIVFAAEAATNDLIISAFRAGATDFVPKPFRTTELEERIESAVNGGTGAEHRTSVETIAQAEVKVYCLGELRILVNGRAVTKWPSRKGRAIFTYLALQRHRQVYRDVLLENFWPHVTPESARDSLNVAIHGVRRLLREIDPWHEHILLREERYSINPQTTLWVDVEEFTNCWKTALKVEQAQGARAALDVYRHAAALYVGDFLEDSLYESWTLSEREHLKETYLDVLDHLSRCCSATGETADAIGICEEILERDACREDIHRRLMECYRKLGRRDRALKQFQKCAQALRSELEASPMPATMVLYEEIKNLAGINAVLSPG